MIASAFTTAGLTWRARWLVFRKRLPSLTAAATIVLSALADANVVALVPERWHWLLRYVTGAATLVLLWTRSVAPGAHGVDYETGLVPERRGTGARTGELPTPTVGNDDAAGVIEPPATLAAPPTKSD